MTDEAPPLKRFGPLERIRTEFVQDPPHERCCFCRIPTQYWALEKDVPCCLLCAGQHKLSDVPTKEDWFTKETQLEQLEKSSRTKH